MNYIELYSYWIVIDQLFVKLRFFMRKFSQLFEGITREVNYVLNTLLWAFVLINFILVFVKTIRKDDPIILSAKNYIWHGSEIVKSSVYANGYERCYTKNKVDRVVIWSRRNSMTRAINYEKQKREHIANRSNWLYYTWTSISTLAQDISILGWIFSEQNLSYKILFLISERKDLEWSR